MATGTFVYDSSSHIICSHNVTSYGPILMKLLCCDRQIFSERTIYTGDLSLVNNFTL